MNIFSKVRKDLIGILETFKQKGVIPQESSFDAVTAEPPRDPSHGDISTNAAMVLAKAAGKNPRELGQLIADAIKLLDYINDVSVAGPGFINMRLDNEVWQQAVNDILKSGISYGNSSLGSGKKINVEYVSANPTGPMHIGHSRGAVVGDALALLLQKAGFDVTKEYYINDAGTQIEKLVQSAYLRYREALGENIGEIPKGFYPGEYLRGVGNALKARHGDKLLYMTEEHWFPVVREHTVNAMMVLIRDDLEALGVMHDVFSSEYALHQANKLEKALQTLKKKGLIYRGVLEPPKGKAPDDWEPREQTLFRSSEYGDDVDRPLQKSDGSWTYFASDIAYHLDKLERGYNAMILVLGADHGGYVKRMKAMVSALSGGKAEIEVHICQLVNYLQHGKPAKMSKRAGTFVTVGDVIEAVGKDIIRFIMLTRKSDAVLDFDLEKVTEQSKDNPVFYVQYAHARAKSVLRNAKEEIPVMEIDSLKNLPNNLLSQLNDPAELALIKVMAQWPRIVESAALSQEPHRIAFYLQEVAAAFHGLWNKGKEHDNLRFIVPGNEELTKTRLALVRALSLVVASGLNVLGVSPVEELH